MKIYGLKNCDTCRKARKALPEAEFIDVRDQGIAGDVLAAAQAEFGAALLNTRSTTWRGLSDEERSQDPLALMAEDEERSQDPLALMAEHPALMKRPLIQAGDQMFLGWTAATQTALGL